jgi:hypothetical protein
MWVLLCARERAGIFIGCFRSIAWLDLPQQIRELPFQAARCNNRRAEALKNSSTFLDGAVNQPSCAVQRCPGRRIFSHLLRRTPTTRAAPRKPWSRVSCSSPAIRTRSKRRWCDPKIELSARVPVKATDPSSNYSPRTRDRICTPLPFNGHKRSFRFSVCIVLLRRV